MSGVQSTNAYSYARNPASGEIHLVVVSRGGVHLPPQRCDLLDDIAAPLELISDEDAWKEFKDRPEAWCRQCDEQEEVT